MDSELTNRICKAIRYRDYETAIFLTSTGLSRGPEYTILLPMLLYMNGEYSRALFHLRKLNTYTSRYYETLCYKKRKDYKKAIKSLEFVIENRAEEDQKVDSSICQMLIDRNDTEFFTALLGDLHTLSGNREEAIGCYMTSLDVFPLFSPVENLLLEGKLPTGTEKENKEVKADMKLEEEYIVDSAAFLECMSQDLLEKYTKHIPGIGSYFISNAARKYFNLGLNDESKRWFDVVRGKDPMFVYNMDYYSTTLWHYKEATELGLLCKNFIRTVPDSSNTWKALGNFYSHEGDYQRSVLCFKRSLCISEDSYAYTLLGYESIQRNEYDAALRYFSISLQMFNDNYRAMFGCGLVYMKTEKFENAEFFLKKAMSLNPGNMQIKVHAMKFYTKRKATDQSIELFCEAFRVKYTDIHKLVEHVISRKGYFNEVEEFLLLEFVEVLAQQDFMELASSVLSCVEYRGESYFRKKELLTKKTE